jgi:hypothetical protein
MSHRLEVVYAKLSPWLFFVWLMCVVCLFLLLLLPVGKM